jgi:poly-beta-hydroxyalkanoate depolymerase
VANKLSKYNSLLMKASRYIYSTPKYRAKDVKVKTKEEHIRDRVSIQNTKCESIKSKQKNHLPKST